MIVENCLSSIFIPALFAIGVEVSAIFTSIYRGEPGYF